MPGSGFEPESSPREGDMIGRTTPTGHVMKDLSSVFKDFA